MRIFTLLLVGFILAGCARSTGPSLAPLVAAERRTPLTTAGFKQLYSFSPSPDGNSPTMDLVLHPNSSKGFLYGTTEGGGARSPLCKTGCGTVYKINPNPTSGQESVVWSFKGRPDGAVPEARFSRPFNGAIYGTTFYGGLRRTQCFTDRGCGTIFTIDASGNESVAYSFNGGPADGSNPSGSLDLLNNKIFYGTTQYGGAHDFGTLFKFDPTSKKVTLIHSFDGGPNDGAYPTGDLLVTGRIIYGITIRGGKGNVGTVFEAPVGSSKETVIHSFQPSEGDLPVGINSTGRTIYGAASADGVNNRGSIFSITLDAHKFSVVHYFQGGSTKDGALPLARPAVYLGILYGTTQGGGLNGVGSIYRIDPTTQPPRECVIHSFGPVPAGIRPDAPLREWGGHGVFYGTTVEGGSYSYGQGLGSVYQIQLPIPCPSSSPQEPLPR